MHSQLVTQLTSLYSDSKHSLESREKNKNLVAEISSSSILIIELLTCFIEFLPEVGPTEYLYQTPNIGREFAYERR